MNSYAVIILIALLASFLLDLVAQLLNLRALRPEPPEEFQGEIDAATYRRTQDYARATTRFALVSSTFDLAVFLAFWWLGGFPWLEELVRSLADRLGTPGEIPVGLLFFGALFLGRAFIRLPFDLYATFILEERFGFNRTTPGTFVADRLKGLLLGVLLGAPILGAVLWFFLTVGDLAWLWAWGSLTMVGFVLQVIFPRFIMPLFNRFEPLAEGELREAIVDYAKRVDFPLAQVFVIDGSRRSSKSNAFFAGFGKTKRLALFDTLVENHSVEELVSVVAHEVGHFKKKHIIQSMLVGILHNGALFYLLSVFLSHRGLYEAFGLETQPLHAGLVFFGLLYTPIEMFLSIGLQMLSRKNEFEADRFAVETTGKGEPMATALRKLSIDNLSNLTPHPFHVFLHYSHPPVIERIAAIRRLAPAAEPSGAGGSAS